MPRRNHHRWCNKWLVSLHVILITRRKYRATRQRLSWLPTDTKNHIGGFLAQATKYPIYAGPLAATTDRGKLEEHGLLRLYTSRNQPLARSYIGNFLFRTHSFRGLWVSLFTHLRRNLCTGDFKFDFTPVGEPADLHRMAAVRTGTVFSPSSDNAGSTQTLR